MSADTFTPEQRLALGDDAFAQGQLDQAALHFEAALAGEPTCRALALSSLGAVLAQRDDALQALTLCQQAVDLLQEHGISTCAQPYSNLASMLMMTGHEVTQALPHWERALSIERAMAQPNQESIASLLMDMAIAAGFVPDWQAALAYIDEAIPLSELTQGQLSYGPLSQRVYRLECLDHLERRHEAREQVNALLKLVTQTTLEQHRDLLESGLPMLASALSQQGRCEEAEDLFGHIERQLGQAAHRDPELLSSLREAREANAQFAQLVQQTAQRWQAEEQASLAQLLASRADTAEDDLEDLMDELSDPEGPDAMDDPQA